jgi:hypothetical protein
MIQTTLSGEKLCPTVSLPPFDFNITRVLKDWDADYRRPDYVPIPPGKIKYVSGEAEYSISHGYGHTLHVKARHVDGDDKYFVVEFTDSHTGSKYTIPTAKMVTSIGGIPMHLVVDYIDEHIDCRSSFEKFVHKYVDLAMTYWRGLG